MEHQLEPNLLQTFRRFILLVWVLLSPGICGMLGDGLAVLPDYSLIFGWLIASLLLLYLSLSKLRHLLGRFYLPVALVFISTVPLLTYALTTVFHMGHGLLGEDAWVDPGGLYLWLILPLLLISLQYSMRVLWAFIIGTSGISILTMLPIAAAGGPALQLTNEQVFVRVLLFGVVGYVIVRISAAQRAQRKSLAQKNAELETFASTLEQLAISRERNRMARELHDTLAHTLSAVNIQLKALDVLVEVDPDAAKNTLKQVQQMTRDGLTDARRALHSLRAAPLEELGLVLALHRLMETTRERTGLQITVDLPEQTTGLAPFVEQSIYRIADEAVANVVRHARAKRVQLVLSQVDGLVQLEISDDGIGFDVEQIAQNGHYGIVGMRERAALCNGQVDIQSTRGDGTCVILRLGEGV